MFDLFRSREKSVRILLGALLVVVGLSMLTYLIPNYNTGGGSASDSVIAEIGKDTITQDDIRRIVQNQMRGRQMPAEILPAYVPQIVDSIINEHALAYEADRLGFLVTDAQVADAVRQFVPNLFPDGKFLGKEAYAQLLQQQGLTIAQFEDEMRRQLLINRLRAVALEGALVSPQEIEQEYKKRNEKIKVEFVKLTADKYKAESQPSAEEMQRNYELNKAQYMTPERRNLSILIADQAKLEQSVNPTDDDLMRAYNQNQANFRVPESVKVRHILFMTQGKPPAEDAQIKAKAEDVLKQVKAGANFDELVTKYSEDPGSKTKGGVYNLPQDGQMVPEFENAAHTLKPGQADLIKTAFGYHIIQVMDRTPARLKPFSEVKGEMAAEWKKQRVSDLMQQISDKAAAMLQKDPTHPEKVAADLNMQLLRSDGVESGRPIPEIGVNADFDQAVTSLRKGEVSSPVQLPGNKIAIAVAQDVLPPRQATFAEVQDKIREQMGTNRAAAAVQTHANELVNKAKSMGGDLGKAAKSMGLEVKTSSDFARNGAVEGLGSASYVQQAFSMPDGSVFGPIPTPDATVVAKLISHSSADMTKFAEQRGAIREELKSQKGRDRGMIFEAGLREALVKQGKIKVHQDVINRLIASYKGA